MLSMSLLIVMTLKLKHISQGKPSLRGHNNSVYKISAETGRTIKQTEKQTHPLNIKICLLHNIYSI